MNFPSTRFSKEGGFFFSNLRVNRDFCILPLCITHKFRSSSFFSSKVLCVQMSQQQERVDVMNSLSQQYLLSNSSSAVILEERLTATNALWRKLQNIAAAKQEALERCVHEQAKHFDQTRQKEILAFRENFAFLRSLYWDSTEGPVIEESFARNIRPTVESLEEEKLYDDNLRQQMELHELFEGIASIEEAVVSEEIADGDMTVMKEALARMLVRTRPCISSNASLFPLVLPFIFSLCVLILSLLYLLYRFHASFFYTSL